MDKVVSKLRRILQSNFKGCKVKLKRLTDSDRFYGDLVWKGFENKDHVDRQELLRDVLEAELTPEERQKVSMIFTYTPAETLVEEQV